MCKKIILFTADWCSSCKDLKQILKKNKVKYEIIEEWVDRNATMSISFGVMSLPTMVCVNDMGEGINIDNEISRYVGVQRDGVMSFLKSVGAV